MKIEKKKKQNKTKKKPLSRSTTQKGLKINQYIFLLLSISNWVGWGGGYQESLPLPNVLYLTSQLPLNKVIFYSLLGICSENVARKTIAMGLGKLHYAAIHYEQ